MKKGFTLVELLAVIVILAIIALIATPIVLKVIDNSRVGAAEQSSTGYVKAIENKILKGMVDKDEISNGVYSYDYLNPEVSGTKPTNGIYNVNNGYVKSAIFCIDGKKIEYVDGKSKKINDDCNDIYGPTIEELNNNDKTYKAVVYLDPTDFTKKCDSSNSTSETGTKTGCMKWYVYKINDNKSYTMILDHNTTKYVAWNITNNVSDGMNGAQKELDDLVIESSWQQQARLITADEIAHIVGADSKINWSSKNESEYFYLDGKGSTVKDWQIQVAKAKGESKYSWLFDYTKGCVKNGCNNEFNDSFEMGASVYGYWTSTKSAGVNSQVSAWAIDNSGRIAEYTVYMPFSFGIRPVITVSQSLFK